jgi:hypothetical protein
MNGEPDYMRALLETPSAPLSASAVSEGVYITSIRPCPYPKLTKLQFFHRENGN